MNMEAQETVETLLLEGLNSPACEMTAQDWQDLRREVRERLSNQEPTAEA